MFLFFAHNMYNPRPRKYNELPANDLSTKEDTTDMKPLWFLLSSSCFCAAIFNFIFYKMDVIFIVIDVKKIDHIGFRMQSYMCNIIYFYIFVTWKIFASSWKIVCKFYIISMPLQRIINRNRPLVIKFNKFTSTQNIHAWVFKMRNCQYFLNNHMYMLKANAFIISIYRNIMSKNLRWYKKISSVW